jgi:glyoxylase-like metal-dependent hydrolase (beta-lactamase superfamily II)
VVPLPIPLSARVVNAYLLLGEPLTLVDPGTDWSETNIELDAALAGHGLRVEDVEQIIITHQHLDHAGLAHRVQERSGAQVVAHGLLGPYLGALGGESMEAEDTYQAEVMRLHGVPEERIQELHAVSRAHRKYGGSVEIDRPVRDGDVVEAGGHRFIVHERPGHSPSDLIFVDVDGRFAIGGDHLLATVSSNPVVHRPLDRPADPRERTRALVTYLDSMRRTATLDLDVILPGHGPPVTEHGRLVGERAEFHERRKQRIMQALDGRARTVHELAIDIWGEVAKRESFLTLSEALGHLDILEDEGRVSAVENGNSGISYEPR